MTYLLLFTAGLLGILGHWWTRWKKGRTTSTFQEYMLANIVYSMGSIATNIMASGGFYASLSDSPTEKDIILAMISSFTSGYTMDSVVNKDVPQNLSELPLDAVTHKEVAAENKLINETLDQINDSFDK